MLSRSRAIRERQKHSKRENSRRKSSPFRSPGRRRSRCFSTTDEHVRPDVTTEQLAKLPPAFKKDGTVTAGNACGMNDAAAAVIVTSLKKARKTGI